MRILPILRMFVTFFTEEIHVHEKEWNNEYVSIEIAILFRNFFIATVRVSTKFYEVSNTLEWEKKHLNQYLFYFKEFFSILDWKICTYHEIRIFFNEIVVLRF